ncbi:CAS1 domain-containing protein [Verticillium alfalfae VaMs.102]|uniref:CAS1 domain-containing protein n=1 Tax=Verticillium alfalfae (strain VaMs.102 / ATCC MYA-4576 / FGSC 10136) TaxID=526221 RepID=C9S7W5_VERA1|nr:CAS1 domain-containing protein [Verticillium alfalfae VaMs.102]EEY14850.1 CAS1 domain-containing protein [Verticillium alfalfae VaMs.102]
MRDELEKKPASIKDQKGPAFAMLGVGAWFSGDDKEGEAPNTVKYEAAISNVSDILGSRKDFWKAPMDLIDGIGNQVFFAPPAGPYYTGKDHKEGKAKAATRVTAMQKWLRETADKWNLQFVWSIPGLVEHDKAAFVDPTQTGFHVIESVAEIKANILLNLRCNARLDRVKGYPYQRTCCSDYGGSKPLDAAGACRLRAWCTLVVCILGGGRGEPHPPAAAPPPLRRLPTWETGSFRHGPCLCAFSPTARTFSAREPRSGTTPTLPSCARRALPLPLLPFASPSRPGPNPVSSSRPTSRFFRATRRTSGRAGCNLSFSSTTGRPPRASTGIYIFVRLLVAAYLFQTGYGHTTFFLVKKDFSFKRMASVMLRLNLLKVQ